MPADAWQEINRNLLKQSEAYIDINISFCYINLRKTISFRK